MPKQIKSWSYSRLGKHKNCPRSAKYTYIDSLADPSGPEALEGSRVHKIAEDWVSCTGDYVDGSPVPTELEQFAEEFRNLRSVPGVKVEEQWGFSSGWKRAKWERAWCRMVLDAHTVEDETARAIDYKNGKLRPEHGEQLELYALGVFLRYPKVTHVTSEIWYLSKGILDTAEFRRRNLEWLIDRWSRKPQRLLEDTEFRANPGRFPCHWCAYNQAIDGPCSDGSEFGHVSLK